MRSTNLLFLAFALVLTGCGSEGSNKGNSAPIPSLRTAEPRYQLANQCFIARHQGSGGFLQTDPSDAVTLVTQSDEATPFFMKPTRLGHYVFFDPQERFLSQTSAAEVPASQLENILKQLGQTVEGLGDFIDLNADVHPVSEGVDQVGEQITAQSLLVSGAVREGAGRSLAMQAKPDDSSEWRISGAAGALDVVNVVTEQGLLAESGASQFRFIPATGCTEFPEISVNARGEPFKGRNPDRMARFLAMPRHTCI